MPVATFSVAAVVRDVIATSSTVDPKMLVPEVMDRIDPSDYEEALRQLLRSYVSSAVAAVRARPLTPSVTPSSSPPSPPPPRKRSGIKRPGKAFHRNPAWKRALGQRMYLPAVDAWKVLGDCTADDLLSIAAERTREASVYADQAARFEALAKAVAEHGVATTKDLPEAVLEEFYGT